MVELEKISILDITPAQYNPRVMSSTEYEKLSNSINEFGVVDPIIINLQNNKIIGGHQRYDVLLNEYTSNESYNELNLLRLGDIGWVFPSTDLEIKDSQHEKALNIALNKISGEWDTTKLSELLIDLDLDGFNVELTGFDNDELKNFNVDFNDDTFAQDFSEEENEISLGTNTNVEDVKDPVYKLLVKFKSEEDQSELFDILLNEGYDVQII